MKFGIVMKQRGEGCDYNIACGTKFVTFDAESRSHALAEAKRLLVGDEDECPLTHDRMSSRERDLVLSSAVLVEVVETLPIVEYHAEVVAARTAAKRERAEEAERELLRRLLTKHRPNP